MFNRKVRQIARLKEHIASQRRQIESLQDKLDVFTAAAVLDPPLEPCASADCFDCAYVKTAVETTGIFSGKNRYLVGCGRNRHCPDFKPKSQKGGL